jgi:hypothetical protein
MAGVQEYQRVQIESSPPEKVNGAAAADMVHLMTELVDNALAFSPPTAPVKISTKQTGDSTIVEISDGGLGIAQDVLNSLNEDLRSGGEVTVETARRMGLLVVSRIAKRHGIAVSLARNTRGGTTATVLIPPALLRGRPTQVQPKQRPGLGAVPSAKSVLPGAVAEQLSNETEPTKPSERPAPVAPVAPAASAASFARPAAAAPAAPASPVTPLAPVSPLTPVSPAAPAAKDTPAQPEAPAAKAATPDVEVDPIAAAINAVTRLPQRAPGATRTGSAMPGAPVGSTGGSLFQRLRASEAAEAAKADLPQREPSTPTTAFAAIDDATAKADADAKATEPGPGLAPASPKALREDAEQHAASTLDDVVTPLPSAPATPVDLPRRGGLSNFHPLNGSRGDAGSNGVVSARARAPVEPVEPVAVAPVEPVEPVEPVAEDDETPPHSWVSSVSAAPAAPTPAPVYDLLDSRSPMPEPTEDETPIFRTLRSRWLSSAGDATWTKSEIEAGWEAAEQVAEKPATQVSRPGFRCGAPATAWCPAVSPRSRSTSPATRRRSGPGSPRTPPASPRSHRGRGRARATVPAQSNTTEEGPA